MIYIDLSIDWLADYASNRLHVTVTSLLRHVQGYGEHVPTAAAVADGDDDDDDGGDDDDVYSISGVSLATAMHTAKHLNSLSRQIKSHLRQELKSTGALSSMAVHEY